jgi:hypothetical protein
MNLQYSINTSLNINIQNMFSDKSVLDYVLCGKGQYVLALNNSVKCCLIRASHAEDGSK